jgi:hypothetical protein
MEQAVEIQEGLERGINWNGNGNRVFNAWQQGRSSKGTPD